MTRRYLPLINIGAVYFRPGASPIVTDADFYRRYVFSAYAMLERSDNRELLQSSLEDTEGDRRRTFLEYSLRRAVKNQSKAARRKSRDKVCDQETLGSLLLASFFSDAYNQL